VRMYNRCLLSHWLIREVAVDAACHCEDQAAQHSRGGRASFVMLWYRPNLSLGTLYTDGALTLLDRQQAYPGGRVEVRVTFVNPDYIGESLMVGASFDIVRGHGKSAQAGFLSIPAALWQEGSGQAKCHKTLPALAEAGSRVASRSDTGRRLAGDACNHRA